MWQYCSNSSRIYRWDRKGMGRGVIQSNQWMVGKRGCLFFFIRFLFCDEYSFMKMLAKVLKF